MADVDTAAVASLMEALSTPEGQANPYPIYRQLRDLGPAVLADDGAVVVTGYRECATLLRNPQLHKNPGPLLVASGHPHWQQRPSLRLMFASLLMLNPPHHTRLRHAVAEAFTAKRVHELRPAIEAIVSRALSNMDGTVDFVSAFAFPVPVAVIAQLLGIPHSDCAMLQVLVHDWTQVVEFLSPLAVDQADEAAAAIIAYLSDLASQRRSRPADDLISALVAADLADDDVVSLAAFLLAAGFETTTGLLTNALVALVADPPQASMLRSQPALAPTAVDELLRYDAPVQIAFSRTASTDLAAGDLQLHSGQRVITLLGAGNRDPTVFYDPDRLHLDRCQQPPLSFGGGIHHCLGAQLARTEAEIALPALLRRYPRIQHAGPPVHRKGITLHSYTSMPINTR